MARKALIHKNTNQTTNNGGVLSPKLPTAGTLQKGEIAVNYKDGYETLSIENDQGEVVPFASLEQIMSYVDNSLPDLELSSNYSTSDLENEDLQLAEGDSYEEAFSKLEKAILDDEEIVATSLVELNDRINDCTSQIPETILSEQYAPSTDSNEDLFLEAGDTYEEAFSKLEKSINDNEQITSAALSDLDERKADLSYVDSLNEPLYVKEYDYTCSANDTDNGYLFFGNIIPTSEKVGETWYIHYKLYVDLQSTNSTYQAYNKYCTGVYDCYVGCSGSSIIYACLNRQFSTSYRPIYYHLLAYYATTTENGTSVSWETKYANRETNPVKVGFRIQSAYRVTDPRHYKIEVYEVYNCSFSFIDPFEKYGNVYTTAKYGACTTISADSGLQESGDANDTTSAVLVYSLLRAGTNGIKTYSLIMEDKDGNWQSFYTGTGSTSVSKTVNPAQFRLGSKVYYVNRSSDLAANSTLGTSQVYTHRTLIDFRYSFPAITSSNTASAGNVGLTAYKPLYILGSIDNQGYFVLDTTKWWTQDEPTTEDNKIYIRVCDAVYLDNSSNINGQYRGDLVDNGTPYWFKDGIFQQYYKTSSGGGGGSGDVNVIETIKVNNVALTPDANKAVNIDLSSYDKAPLVIEVNDTDTTVPSGTYTNIGNALANGREVYIKMNGDDSVIYLKLCGDFSEGRSACYEFQGSTVMANIWNGNTLSIEFDIYAASDHNHGDIDNDGTLNNSQAISIANGDRIVITDASNNDKIQKTSTIFDGSTTTTALTPKGTWEPFLKTAPVQSVNGQTGAVTLALGQTNVIETVKVNGTTLTPDSNKAVDITVPAAITESTVSGWGFTKNTGTYSIPSGGIPANDLASSVQTSLGKADTALQSFTESDPTVPSHVKEITTTDISNWNNKLSSAPVTSVNGQTGAVSLTIPSAVTESTVSGWGFTKNTGTVTGVKINGTTKNPTSGVVDLGSVLTSETSLSKGTTSGSGNAVTDISVSGHTITLTKGSTFLTSHQNIKTVNGNSLVGTGNVSIDTLPTVTASDNGKVLQVVNGAWSLVTPVAIYSGTATPSNSTGNNGDLYLQTS